MAREKILMNERRKTYIKGVNKKERKKRKKGHE